MDNSDGNHLSNEVGGRTSRVSESHSEQSRAQDERAGTRPPEECPPHETWLLLAENLLAPEDADRYAGHAASCARCAPLLRQAILDAESERSSESLRAYEHSVVSTPEWQSRFARTLASAARDARDAREQSEPRRKATGWHRSPLWRLAAAAAVVLAVYAGWRYQRDRWPDHERLLAQAYSEQRTLELRFPGAAHAPLRTQRGAEAPGASSRLDRSRALIAAEAVIVDGLEREPTSGEWLQAKGRADLLAWNYDAAIASFRRALDLRPDAPDLLTDLASAYFERAEAAKRPMDYGMALDLLTRAQQQTPDDPVILFNRAIVAGKLFLYDQAVDDFEKLLILEGTGGWTEEARARLQQLRQARERNRDRQPISNKPAAFLEQRDSGILRAPAASRSDELLETAVLSWLLVAIDGGSTAPAARRALSFAADWLAANSHDVWLRELLQNDLRETDAIRALSEAVAANLNGDPVKADAAARRAASLFDASANAAGAARARVEQVYSAHRSVDAARCLSLAEPLERDIDGRRYAWAEGQLWIEDSICASMHGDFDRAAKSLDRGLGLARSAKYGTLTLRALGMKAALQNTMGDTLAAWRENLAGLEFYWSGSFPPQRAYQFYADLAFVAQRHERWHLAASISREAVGAISQTTNRSTQAMAWHRLGTLAQQATLGVDAVHAFERANAIFASLPEDDAARRYRLDCWINLAFLEASDGNTSSRLEHLESLRKDVDRITDINIALRYHYTLGVLYQRAGDARAAEAAFREALVTSDRAFANLESGRERDAWEAETEKIYRSIVELLVEHARADEGFALWRRFRAPAAARASTVPASNTSSDELGIFYAQVSSGIIIWADNGGAVVHRVSRVATASLERLVRRFAEECADPEVPLASLSRDSRALYDMLIAPVAQQVDGARRLVLHLDGVLTEVPFQALQDASGQPLARTRDIAVLVAGEHAADWRRLAITSDLRALVVGAPEVPAELRASFQSLPHAVEEADDVAARFGRHVLLTGETAKHDAIARELPSAALFHFAGHAVAEPDGGALIVAPGDRSGPFFGAAHIGRLDLRRYHLAVLSACSTGTRDLDARVSRLGVVRRFVRAGVPQVLATRWNIDSAAAATFMRAYYDTLLESGSTSTALKRAVTSTMDHPATAHPYYWAAFSLYVAS